MEVDDDGSLLAVADALWEYANRSENDGDAKTFERAATKYFWKAVGLERTARVFRTPPPPAATGPSGARQDVSGPVFE